MTNWATGTAFQRRLFDAGLAGVTIPVEYGGQGLTREHEDVLREEAAGVHLPTGVFTITLGMCVPVLLQHGSEQQKRRHIAPMLRADETWCQLFSEPNAGSDVAAAQLRAVRDGDEWALNGQKVWTSSAERAAFGMCIARTDPDVPKHRGPDDVRRADGRRRHHDPPAASRRPATPRSTRCSSTTPASLPRACSASSAADGRSRCRC